VRHGVTLLALLGKCAGGAVSVTLAERVADACTKVGELGAMLRREGIYSSSLAGWRRARDAGGLGALEPKKRGPKVVVDARDKQVAELQRAVARAEARARQAEGLVELQKKMAEWMANQPRLEDETP